MTDPRDLMTYYNESAAQMAEAMGLHVEDLTTQDRQVAMMDATLEYGERLMSEAARETKDDEPNTSEFS